MLPTGLVSRSWGSAPCTIRTELELLLGCDVQFPGLIDVAGRLFSDKPACCNHLLGGSRDEPGG